MKMTIERSDDGLTKIRLEGRMDLEGTRQIDQQFAYATSTHAMQVGIDLANVSFVASIGLRTLITGARAQAGRGGRMVLVGPNAMVRGMLVTAGIDSVLPIYPDWTTAKAGLQAG